MSTAVEGFDVVVVGLGPVGATMTALLGQAGLRVLVVEPSHDIYPLPRAAHLDHEVMRIFQSLGLAERLTPYLRPAPNYEFRGAEGSPFMLFVREGVTGASGWPLSFNIYQPGIEAELRKLIAGMPNVEVRFGARFESVVGNDADGVVAHVAQEGRSTQVHGRFLLGCDGAWSPVRESLGIKLDDYAFDEPWLVLDALVPDETHFPSSNLQICDPDRPTTFVHMGPGRLRWEFMLKPGEDPKAMQQPAALAELLRPWRELGGIEIERSAVYRFHGLVARQWRVGRAFLAGDAAHQMPPFLGQGMCSGLRDAANLAWKIERAVRSGWNEGLMDSYQQEREPHVRFIIEKAIEMGRLVCTLDPEAARRRDAQRLAVPQVGRPVQFPPYAEGWLLDGSAGAGQIFPQPVERSGAPVFLDDLLDRRAWLLLRGGAGGTLAPTEQVRVVRTSADLPAALRAPISEWLDTHRCEAVLVRPDRYVFGTGEPQPLLDAYLHHKKRIASTDEPQETRDMRFLRNCWYVAGHAEEAGPKPFGRKLLNEPIVVYRTESGALKAMDDRCAHRFAPMHQGKVCGELLQCPYHGLMYDTAGVCVAVPTGGEPPPRARLKTYPIESRYGMLWIWMGDPALADPDRIPDFSRLEHDDADWMTVTLYAKGNYQLLVDNLLDLSHVEFLHPFLASEGWAERAKHTLEQDGDTVTYKSVAHQDNAIALAMQMKPDLTPVGTSIQTERWDPPSVLQLSVEYYSDTGNWIVPSGHFLTPETETTTHYFLRAGNTVDKANAQMTASMKAGTIHVFESEDIAMIEAQQRNIGNVDLMDLHPAILAADAGAVRARRILAKKIRDEAEAGKAPREPKTVPIARAVEGSH